MTDQQAAELAALSAAVQADYTDRQAKAALAVQEMEDADRAAAAAAQAEREAEAASLKLIEDLKKLRAYVEEIVNPPAGVSVDWGTPKPKEK